MINKKNKLSASILLVVVLSVLSVNLISAFGTAFPAGSVEMYPGEMKNVEYYIGTSAREGELTVKAEIIDNAGIATITDSNTNYPVSVGSETPVNIKLNVDETASIGQEYTVVLKFSDVTSIENTGMVAFTTSATTRFTVKVVEKPVVEEAPAPEQPAEEESNLMLWLLGIVVVVIVIFMVLKVMKKKDDNPAKKEE
jgi:hypothetical protein